MQHDEGFFGVCEHSAYDTPGVQRMILLFIPSESGKKPWRPFSFSKGGLTDVEIHATTHTITCCSPVEYHAGPDVMRNAYTDLPSSLPKQGLILPSILPLPPSPLLLPSTRSIMPLVLLAAFIAV